MARRYLFDNGWPRWLWALGRIVNRVQFRFYKVSYAADSAVSLNKSEES